jgi:hypothetical protein
VADNQPYKNRMNDLSKFAARLRRFILETGGASDAARGHQGWFKSMALELFALQFEHNAAYRRFCEGKGITPRMLQDWTEIPAIPAVAFKEGDLTSLPAAQRIRIFHSSGTTGHRPSRHFHSDESLRVYEESLLAGFTANFLGSRSPTRQRMIFLTPPAEAAPHSSLAHMFETVCSTFGNDDSIFAGLAGSDGGWQLDTRAATRALEAAVERKQPALIFGTAFSYVHLLDYLSAQHHQFALPAGSRLMETGGYKGRSRALPRAELHALLRRQLGAIEIVCEYGMSELSSQAYAGLNGETEPFRFPAWARVRVVSPETGNDVEEGQAGLIQVFDLANVYSVIAIQTEDLGVRRGTGFGWVGRAETAEARGCSLMATQ